MAIIHIIMLRIVLSNAKNIDLCEQTLADLLSMIPMTSQGPPQIVIFDIHALQVRFYFQTDGYAYKSLILLNAHKQQEAIPLQIMNKFFH